MNFTLNTRSRRAIRAKLAKRYAKPWLFTSLKILSAASFVAGAGLLAAGEVSGWLAFIPGSYAFMFYSWIKGDLKNRNTEKTESESIELEKVLEFELLANLNNNEPSAYDLWKALEKSEERYFLANRYLLDSSFFETFLNKNPGSSTSVWPVARQLSEIYWLEDLSNMAILVSLVQTVPQADQILKTVQLDLKDIETSVPWMRDVLEKRRLARAKQSFGGIGRDWSFGYSPILGAVGYNISRDIEAHGFFSDTTIHASIVQQMIQLITNGNGTVTLVGDTGVGKTTCVHAFAEHILKGENTPESIRHNQVVSLDAPTLIANAKNPGQLEELMLRIFSEAHKAKNIILFFDDAEVFFGLGSTIDLTHVLQPALEAHSLKIILAMSPASWQKLSGSNAVGKMQPLTVAPADEQNTLDVLRDSVSLAEYRNKTVFTYQALKEGYKLASRYVTSQAMPGAALSLLEQAANTAGSPLITREAVQASVEQTYGIKLQATSQTETSQLLNLEQELKQYVISQDRAVTVVSDALRRARSGVGNPNRPVGTFLFLGPTGVGKTELSKALARVYYGDESALVRVDMNQFVEASGVSRLIEPMNGNELGLLGQIRKQPFAVVLLDEIEKAHSSVINALLQMLDEGVMRDADNRAVSFRDAIIIATSNAGADEIRRMIDEGENIDQAESKFTELLISRGLFAPEFINRFDEVVIFKPLEASELLSVVDLILADINKNLDAQKVRVELTPSARQWLVEKGYDPKLGARPMRRVVQRYVENTVAKKLLNQSLISGQTLTLNDSDFI